MIANLITATIWDERQNQHVTRKIRIDRMHKLTKLGAQRVLNWTRNPLEAQFRVQEVRHLMLASLNKERQG